MFPPCRMVGLVLAGLSACAVPPPPPTEPPPVAPAASTRAAQPAPVPGADTSSRTAPVPAPEPAAATPLAPLAAQFVALHAQVRTGVSPPASPPLETLRWDAALAQNAAAHAARCPEGHQENSPYGENMFWAGGSFDDASIAEMAVSSWASEAVNYDYHTTVCRQGRQADWSLCGHYTQLVDRRTSRVGCGVRLDCPGDFRAVVVCVYDPPGNVNADGVFVRRPY